MLAKLSHVLTFFAITSTAIWLVPTTSHAGGFTPQEAVSHMVLPTGFKAEVFASEPMIRQPVTASFDSRGRLWVIEYLQYPNPTGLKPVSVDQYLRTKYDRVPEPPPRGPRGADRIKILEDTDGDGKADKATIFVEGLNIASALAVGHGGVWVGQAPYLLFYPDRDGDDKPDGDPEVHLTGFGLEDAHSTMNSMAFGPDGWLYGTQGSTVTANIRGIGFQQGIWRYHPKTKQFELFAEGGGNTWGLDWDSTGNAFGSSNGSFITFHVIQGGYYWKGFAKHGPLHNPRTYGYFDAIAYDGTKQGGHVTPGGIIYNGDNFPESFRGKFIGGNLLSNTVYWHNLKADGSTFRGSHGGTLVDSHDNWFRPIDLTLGPDGCVYVVDWYDRRASHLDPRDNWDKTNGRIYRISYGDAKKVSRVDLKSKSTAELIGLRTSKNDWQASMARQILAERHDRAAIPKLTQLLSDDRDDTLAVRDLWALYVSGGLTDELALSLLGHPVAAVRHWTIRLLGDEHRMSASLLASLKHLAETDSDPRVRSQLASSAQRWQTKEALVIVDALVARNDDKSDRHIPLQLWWACEHHLTRDHATSVKHMLNADFIHHPLVKSTILERLSRYLISSGSDDENVAKLLALVSDDKDVDIVVAGLLKGLEGRRLTGVPAALASEVARISQGNQPRLDRELLALRLGDAKAYARSAERVTKSTDPDSTRISMIEVIGQIPRQEGLHSLLELARHETKPNVLSATIAAIGSYDSPVVAEVLLGRYAMSPDATKTRIVDLLSSRKGWAIRLVDAIAKGTIPTKEIRPTQVIAINGLKDQELTNRLIKAWGRVPGPGSPEKIRRVAEVRGMLPEGDKGSATRGSLVFKESCAVCHKLFGQGENIGPELTQAERGNLDFLLTSLVDPSALIRKEYQARTVVTTDGRTLTGLVLEENDKTLTLIDSKRQKTVLPVKEIDESKPSDVSLMPEGVLDALKDEQIRDLFKYLQSSGPGGR
jgi:putative membrane-bound dehydrogenase-like protein